MVSVRRLLLAVAVLLVLAAGAALALYFYAGRWQRTPLPGLTTTVVIEVAPGEPLARVADGLAARGVLDEPRLFTWLARREGKAARVQAGEYALVPGTSPLALLEQLVEGRVILHPVTLVEGWTVATALESLHANPLLKPAVPVASDPALMARLGAPGVAAEGEFFPDTYLVPKGATDLEILKRAHAQLEERLATAWLHHRADLPLATPYEALIMASIIEKETGRPDERRLVAGVFVNRQRRGMALQTDPSVIYGLGGRFDGRLHRRDLETDTPYNTYLRAGLPPTPIGLPGRASIEAALNPDKTTALYFVARGDGSSEFSATLAEHNRAVDRYQRAGVGSSGAPGQPGLND